MENILVACDYGELNKYTPVFNLMSLQSFIWVNIPKKLCKCSLYEIHDLSKQQSREINFYGKIQQDYEHPWIKIPLEILDMKSGKHTYKLCFLDVMKEEFTNTFISYISQDDNPETPYVYMSGRGNTHIDANKWKDGSYSDEYFDNMRKSVIETYGYDPLLYSNYTQLDYCSRCTTLDCNNCSYKL